MASIADCAILSEDVYSTVNNNLAASAGWVRVDGRNWSSGFAAGMYTKDEQVVIAFRGTDTDDLGDIEADIQMIPDASPMEIARVTPAFIQRYGLDDITVAQFAGAVLTRVLQATDMLLEGGDSTNRVPEVQCEQATRYIAELSDPPTAVTGHSLGGALAKYISLDRQLLCVAFNSPHMGALQGVTQESSRLIYSVNTDGDPLSLATRAVGNLPHGQLIDVTIPPPAEQPPTPPIMQESRRPSFCPQRREDNSMEAIVNNRFAEVCEPIVQVASLSYRQLRYRMDHGPYVVDLFHYAASVAGYFHKMSNLRQVIYTDMAFHRDPPASE